MADPLGRAAARATMGRLATVLMPGGVTMTDRASACEVELLASDIDLSDADEAGLAQGRNLCLIGSELLQFTRAEQTGEATWRLTGLRRGLRGSEWAMGAGHRVDAPFLLIEQERLFAVPPSAFAGTGGLLTVLAIGIGDGEPAEASLTVRGEAMLPPAPVHGRALADGSGGWSISWVRRSRGGWDWRDGVDAPLSEESERYAVSVIRDDLTIRTVEVAAATWSYYAAMIAADGGGDVRIAVRQIGALGIGRALLVALNTQS